MQSKQNNATCLHSAAAVCGLRMHEQIITLLMSRLLSQLPVSLFFSQLPAIFDLPAGSPPGAHVWTNQCRATSARSATHAVQQGAHARTPDECLQPEPDRSDRSAEPARLSVRSRSTPFPFLAIERERECQCCACACQPFPGPNCSSMACLILAHGEMGSSWSGPLRFLRAGCVRGKCKRPIFCRMHCLVQKSSPVLCTCTAACARSARSRLSDSDKR